MGLESGSKDVPAFAWQPALSKLAQNKMKLI